MTTLALVVLVLIFRKELLRDLRSVVYWILEEE
jgi:hypothetical protein